MKRFIEFEIKASTIFFSVVLTTLLSEVAISQTKANFYLSNNILVKGQKVGFVYSSNQISSDPLNFYILDQYAEVRFYTQWPVDSDIVKGNFLVPDGLGDTFYIAIQNCNNLEVIPVYGNRVLLKKSNLTNSELNVLVSINETLSKRKRVEIGMAEINSDKMVLVSVRPHEYGRISDQVVYNYKLTRCYKGSGFTLLGTNNEVIAEKRVGITQTDEIGNILDLQFAFTDSGGRIFPKIIKKNRRDINITLMSDDIMLKKAIPMNDGLKEIAAKVGLINNELTNNIELPSKLIKEQSNRVEILNTYQKSDTCENDILTPYIYFLPEDYKKSIGEYFALTSFVEVVKELLPYVKYKKRGGIILESNVYNHHRSRATSTLYNYPTLCLINNQVVHDINDLIKLSPSKIDYIGVYLNKYIIDNNFHNGILSLHTKANTDKVIVKNNLIIPMNEEYVISCNISNQTVNFDNPIYFEATEADNESYRFSFTHTDETGLFRVETLLFDRSGEASIHETSYKIIDLGQNGAN